MVQSRNYNFDFDPLSISFHRLSKLFAASLLVVLPVALSSCQPASKEKAGGKTEIAPATTDDIYLYRGIGASFLCNARSAGVEFPKAVGIAAATYAQVLDGKHGGIVAAAGKEKLSNKQLFAGAEFQIVTAALQYCPKEVPEDVKEKVKIAIEKANANNKN